MGVVDILMGFIALVSVLVGAARGFLRELVALVSWVLGLWGAWLFGPLLEAHLASLPGGVQVRVWVARLLVLALVLFVGALVGLVLALIAQGAGLGWLDRLIGMMFGGLRALVLLGLVAICGELLHLDQEPWWHRSVLVPYCVKLGDWERAMVGEHGEPWSKLERLNGARTR